MFLSDNGRILNVFMYYWVILTLCDFYVFFGHWNTREESINVEITVRWKKTLDWALYFCHLFYTYLVCILFTYHPIHFVIVSDNGWNSESIHVQIVTLVDVIFYNLCFYRTLKTQQLSTKMTHSRPWNITGKEKKLPQMQQDFVKQFWRKIQSLVRGYEKSEGIERALYVHHN